MTTNGKVVKGKGATTQDPLGSLITTGKDLLHDYEAAIDRAMENSMAIREAEAKFGTPGTAGIEVRHDQGLLHRENPQDRKRADALKANWDRKILSAHDLNDLGGLAVAGEQFVLATAKHLSDYTDALPAHLQPLGHTLTNATVKILSAQYIESLKFNAERSFPEIDQATKPREPRQ